MQKRVSPYKTALDQGNAYWMARLSKEVYKKTSKNNEKPNEAAILESLQQDDGEFVSVTAYDKNSAQAAVIEHEDYLCMAFRGTNEISDWIDNINLFSVKTLFGKFHRGFFYSVDDLWQQMSAKCFALQNKKNNKKRPIFFTGHSLGGAMATVAAAKFIHDDKPFTSVYTFGQPRAVSRKTALVFNADCKNRFFRFHNNNDIVTRVPARFMNYSHVGSYLYISDEKEIYHEPGFWFRFVDYFDGAFSDALKLGLDGIKDHEMDRYLKAVSMWNTQF